MFTSAVKTECCPICQRPAEKYDSATHKMVVVCSFFYRCRKLKMDGDPQRSAELRSKMFRDYHADVCPTCHLPHEECRKKRLQAVRRERAKYVREGSSVSSYLTPSELVAAVDKQKCKPIDRKKIDPILPDWYVPAKE